MSKLLTASILAITVASGAAFAQTTAPTAPAAPVAPAITTAPKATTAPVMALDAATEAKFKAADKNNDGFLDGAEITAYKADMAKIDADKDGKLSRAEFASAVKSGVIK